MFLAAPLWPIRLPAVRNVSVSPVAIVTLKFVLSGVVAPATVQPRICVAVIRVAVGHGRGANRERRAWRRCYPCAASWEYAAVSVIVPVPVLPVPPVACDRRRARQALAIARATGGMPPGGTNVSVERDRCSGRDRRQTGQVSHPVRQQDAKARLSVVALPEDRCVGDALVDAQGWTPDQIDRRRALRHERQVQPLGAGQACCGGSCCRSPPTGSSSRRPRCCRGRR